MKTPTPSIQDRVAEMYQQDPGITAKQIQDRLDCTPYTAQGTLRRVRAKFGRARGSTTANTTVEQDLEATRRTLRLKKAAESEKKYTKLLAQELALPWGVRWFHWIYRRSCYGCALFRNCSKRFRLFTGSL